MCVWGGNLTVILHILCVLSLQPATESYQTPAATASTEDTFVPVTSDDEMFSTLTGQILTSTFSMSVTPPRHFKTMVSKRASYPVAEEQPFPHYIIFYVLIFALSCILIVLVRCFVKEKAKIIRRLNNMIFFHNLKPIYRHHSDNDIKDYLEPNSNHFSDDSDSYESVLFDRTYL